MCIFVEYQRVSSWGSPGTSLVDRRNASHMDFNFPEKKGTGALGCGVAVWDPQMQAEALQVGRVLWLFLECRYTQD